MHVKRIHEMVETLTCTAKEQFDKGVCNVDTQEMGEVIDMIKDLCCAEKDAYESKFYKAMVEQFGEDGAAERRYGYDNWRYSSGRFAPKGRGHMSGYVPMPTTWDRWPSMDPEDMTKQRLGYDDTYDMSRQDGRAMSSSDKNRPYDKWNDARRHYHETGNPDDKKEMDRHAQEHVMETVETIKTIWGDADPVMKAKMKTEMEELLRNMK